MKRYFGLLVIVFILVGCSSLSIRTYSKSIRPLLQQLDDPARSLPLDEASLAALNHGSNQLLYFLEKGRVAQIQGDFKNSLEHFSEAIDYVDQQTAGAMIDLSQLGQKSLSLAINDKVLDYVMPADQRSFLQAFQALNYLFLHQLDGAAVEARRGSALYQKSVDDNHAARQAIEKKVDQLALDPEVLNKASESYLNSLPAPENLPRYSFLNAYSFFINGLIFELSGELNDAVIEYKKALALDPRNSFIQQRLARLTQRTHQAMSEVIVIYEQGWIPSLQSENISIIWNGHLQWISLPIYSDPWLPPVKFTLQNDQDKKQLIGAPLVDVYGLAVQSLKERSSTLMVRQLLRLAIKINLGRQARQQAGDFGLFLSDIYNVISEQADVRGWLSLPRGIQLASISLKPGSHTLFWRDPQTGLSHPFTIKISAHQTHIVRIVNTGKKLHVQAIAYKNPLL